MPPQDDAHVLYILLPRISYPCGRFDQCNSSFLNELVALAPTPPSSMDLKSKANSYEAFVKEIAVDFPQFKALVAFLNAPKLNLALSKTPAFLSGPATTKDDIISDSETDSTFSCPSLPSRRPSNRSIITHHITRLQFNPNEAAAIATSVDLDKLEKALSEQGIGNQLFIVNDLSPRAVRLFGGYWNIDPQFFLDYIDVLPKDNARANERGIRPAPWFRHEDIEHHLPMLRSMDAERQHVTIRYVGPREHRTEDENAPSVRLGSRGILHPGFDNCYIQRGGGGLDPIYPEHKSFWKWLSATLKLARRDPLSDEKDFPKLWPVSMVRNSAATWFGKENSGQWKNGE